MEVNGNTLHMQLQRKAGEGFLHKCGAACLAVCTLHILPALLCYCSSLRFYLVPPITNNTMQIRCHWGRLGAIKQSLDGVQA